MHPFFAAFFVDLQGMAKRIIISVTNDLGNDQRVHREAMTLQEMGFEVCLVGRKRKASTALVPRSYSTKRLAFFFESGKWFYLAYAFKMFWWLLFQRADAFWANDMDTLLPNFLVAKIRGKKLIYDSHEYWTEVPELVNRPGTRKVWLWLEKQLFPKVDRAITVNQSIADIYQKGYQIPVGVFRNLPFRTLESIENGPKATILMYQGALNLGRGIELMMDTMEYLPEYQLWIAGYGSFEQELQAYASKCEWKARIQFKGFVEPEALKKMTREAKLGLSLEEDLGASYHFALPNKLFDYLQAGLPVLVSALPEMKAVVSEYQVGEVLVMTERAPKLVAKQIRGLCENEAKYQELVGNTQKAAKILNWENEKGKLVEMISTLNI